jgi:hypothetical protein
LCIATYAVGWRVACVKSCVALNEMGNVEQPWPNLRRSEAFVKVSLYVDITLCTYVCLPDSLIKECIIHLNYSNGNYKNYLLLMHTQPNIILVR